MSNCRRAYTGCKKASKPVFVRHPSCPALRPSGSRHSMNSFELNKILGAILGTCLIVLSLNIGAGAIFAPEKPAKPGYAIAVQDHAAGGPARAAEGPEQPIEVLMAAASAEKGQA